MPKQIRTTLLNLHSALNMYRLAPLRWDSAILAENSKAGWLDRLGKSHLKYSRLRKIRPRTWIPLYC